MKKGRKKLEPLPVRAAKMLRRLKHVRGLSIEQKAVHALGLAATPEERWELWQARNRVLGYWKGARATERDKRLVHEVREFWPID